MSRKVGQPQTPILAGEMSHDLPLTLNPAAAAERQSLARSVEGLVGLGEDRLTTDEATYLLDLLLRRAPRDDDERQLMDELKSLSAGQLAVRSFRRILNATRVQRSSVSRPPPAPRLSRANATAYASPAALTGANATAYAGPAVLTGDTGTCQHSSGDGAATAATKNATGAGRSSCSKRREQWCRNSRAESGATQRAIRAWKDRLDGRDAPGCDGPLTLRSDILLSRHYLLWNWVCSFLAGQKCNSTRASQEGREPGTGCGDADGSGHCRWLSGRDRAHDHWGSKLLSIRRRSPRAREPAGPRG